MKRIAFRTKPKARRAPNPLKAGQMGESAVQKGPARDKAHLASIRLARCVACGTTPCEAHHVRCIGPRTMGKRVSDHLAIALCNRHHAKLHTMNEGDFWIVCNIRPAKWIAQFSAEGAATIDQIEAQRRIGQEHP